MSGYGVAMIRENMENIPDIPFPKGYGVRNFREGEGYIWTRIHKAAEPYIKVDDELFQQQFGENLDVMPDRSFFIVTDEGEEVGTITAWWISDWRGKDWGLIHWVAIHPDHQGKGLAKPAMSKAMKRLKQSHERALLHTATKRIIAIKVYLDFGFHPDLEADNSQEAWSEVAAVLPHPTLKEYGF